jgi:hypothetical protein
MRQAVGERNNLDHFPHNYEEWRVHWLYMDPSMRSQTSKSTVKSYQFVTRSQNNPATCALMILGAYTVTAQGFGLWSRDACVGNYSFGPVD